MPVITPKERWSERSYKEGDGATRVFDVPLDQSEFPTEQKALDKVSSTFGVHAGASHPMDPLMRVPTEGLSVDTSKGPLHYKVTAGYKWNVPIDDKNPLNRKPQFKFLPSNSSESYDRDLDGNPILNSVGDVPSNRPVKFVGSLEVYVKRWEAFYDASKWVQFNNSINADTFRVGRYSIEPGQAFFLIMEQLDFQNYDATAVEVGYRILLKEGKFKVGGVWDSHMERFIDRGRRAFFPGPTSPTGAASRPVRGGIYTTDDGVQVRVNEDVNLNGDGRVVQGDYLSKAKQKSVSNNGLPKGATAFASPDASAYYLIYDKKYKRNAFSQLGLF